jgi:hypothetical protein
MTQTKAERLADKLNSCIKDPSTLSSENFYLFAAQDELRRLSPMEARVKELEDAQDKACAIIINLWVQYGYTGDLDGSKDLPLEISHDFMSAGEEATCFLQANGCALDTGQHASITTKGLKLSEWDSNFLGYDEIAQTVGANHD